MLRGTLVAILLASVIILLSWHLDTDLEQSVCSRTLWDGAGSSGRFLGTKTPYSLLRQIQEKERGAETVQDRLGCQVIKVRQCGKLSLNKDYLSLYT